jgi:hypothetical protein
MSNELVSNETTHKERIKKKINTARGIKRIFIKKFKIKVFFW